MAAGHIVNGQCVDVANSADMYFSQIPSVIQAGNPASFSVLERVSNGWYQTSAIVNSDSSITVISSTLRLVPGFPSCDTTEQFFDGLTLGWGVVAAMVAAWAINVLRRAI